MTQLRYRLFVDFGMIKKPIFEWNFSRIFTLSLEFESWKPFGAKFGVNFWIQKFKTDRNLNITVISWSMNQPAANWVISRDGAAEQLNIKTGF